MFGRVERGDRLGLHPEAGDEVGVAPVLGAEDLDGDVTAELAVGRAVDRGHPALAEQLDQPISPAEDASDLSQVLVPRCRWQAGRAGLGRAWYRTG